MSNQQCLEASARILYYKLFNYDPSLEDIYNGLEYEYEHLSCDHYSYYRYGKWKSPWGIARKDHMRQMKTSRKLRIRNFIETEKIKSMLQQGPLEFQFNDLNVVILSRKMALTPLVYINGVSEDCLRAKYQSGLYKKWFNKEMKDEVLMSDFRYLLDLDRPRRVPPTNILYKYLKGMYTKPITTFDEISKNFMQKSETKNPQLEKWPDKTIPGGGLESDIKNNHIVGANTTTDTSKSKQRTSRKRKKKLKKSCSIKGESVTLTAKQVKQLKRQKQSEEKQYPRWSEKKANNELSDYVKEQQRLKKEKLEKRIQYEIKRFFKEQKKFKEKVDYMKQKEEENRTLMEETKLVCIKSKKGFLKASAGEVFRIKQKDAKILVDRGVFQYTSKTAYKAFLATLVPKQGPNPPQYELRRSRRYKEPKKGTGYDGATLQVVYDRKLKNVDKNGYAIDDKGKPISVSTKRKSFDPVYEEVPIQKNIWKKDPETGKMQIVDVVPVMKPIIDEKGITIGKEYATKLVYKGLEYFHYKYDKVVKAVLSTITTRSKPIKRRK